MILALNITQSLYLVFPSTDRRSQYHSLTSSMVTDVELLDQYGILVSQLIADIFQRCTW